jgi:hypothetical protein
MSEYKMLTMYECPVCRTAYPSILATTTCFKGHDSVANCTHGEVTFRLYQPKEYGEFTIRKRCANCCISIESAIAEEDSALLELLYIAIKKIKISCSVKRLQEGFLQEFTELCEEYE